MAALLAATGPEIPVAATGHQHVGAGLVLTLHCKSNPWRIFLRAIARSKRGLLAFRMMEGGRLPPMTSLAHI
jgi:hypothetical protein